MALSSSKKNIFRLLILGAVAGWLIFYIARYKVATDIADEGVQFTNQQGDTLSLADFQGQTLFVNCYASWCGPCMKEMPDLEAFWKDSKPQQDNLQFIALTDDSWEKIEMVERKFNLTFPVYKIVDDLNSAGVYTIPTSFLIDENGKTIKKSTGVINPDRWFKK